jgi:arabinofuranosyltransferase
LIAVHDIGAIGYFSNRKLVDLAGLVSPQVIPFIRDEKKLADYLDRQNIDYLVTFPTWYVELPKHGTVVFDTNGKYAPKLGGENMRVYQWDK